MHTTELTNANFNQVIDANDLVFVDFWASWCGPCTSFAPIFEAAAEKHDDIVFGKIDTEAEQALAQAFNIRSIPTLMIFKQQVVVFSQPGAVPAGALEQLIGNARALDMDQVRAKLDSKKRADP